MLIESLKSDNVNKIFAHSNQSGCIIDKKMVYFWGSNGYENPVLTPRVHPKSFPKNENFKIIGKKNKNKNNK